MVGPIVDSRYIGMYSSTPSVNFAYKTLVKWLSYEVLHLQNHSQNSVFQPSEKIYFENFSPGQTMLGPIADTRECLAH